MAMLATALLLFQVGTAGATPSLDSAGNSLDWMARPNARAMAECVSGALPKGVTVVTLSCRTASKDRLTDCTAEGSDPKAAKTALCAARHFRIRATASDGQVVTGTAVSVPITLSR